MRSHKYPLHCFGYFLQIFISSFPEMLLPFTTENNDVLSAKSFTVHCKLFDKLSNKEKNGPRMESSGTPALTCNHSDV